jgi:hypothetical protein
MGQGPFLLEEFLELKREGEFYSLSRICETKQDRFFSTQRSHGTKKRRIGPIPPCRSHGTNRQTYLFPLH